MARKLITKKMMKGVLDLNDIMMGEEYQDIIADINCGIGADYWEHDSMRATIYNRALRDVLVALLFIHASYKNGDKAEDGTARATMLEVMYKYRIATRNTAEQNLRGLNSSCFSYSPQAFKFTACLNMGLDHYDIEKK